MPLPRLFVASFVFAACVLVRASGAQQAPALDDLAPLAPLDDLAPLTPPKDKEEKNYFVFECSVQGTSSEYSPGDPKLGDWRRHSQITNYRVSGAVEMKAERALPGLGDFAWGSHTRGRPSVAFSIDAYTNYESLEFGEGLVSIIVRNATTVSGAGFAEADLNNLLIAIDLKKKTYTLKFMVPMFLTPGGNPATITSRKINEAHGDPAWSLSYMRNTPPIEERKISVTGIETLYGYAKKGLDPIWADLWVQGATRPLPSREGGGLADTIVLPIPPPTDFKGDWDVKLTVRFALTRVLPPVELIVTSEGYDHWRPTASRDGTGGEPIEFVAELRSPLGNSVPVQAESFEWRLDGVSSEPGIAMNCPVGAKDHDWDLRFEPLAGQRLADGKDGLMLIRDKAQAKADRAQVVPRDWGAWGELTAVAVLPDGRRITGKFLPTGQQTILLPKREKGTFIAESWLRDKNQVGAKQDTDDETDPVGLKGADGDGFTLYEEYRGFYVAGKHVEGDPKRKDFFVCNFVGADAYPGIRLFEDVSGLRVHDGLRDDEYDPGKRVMNANHREGPHRVDQHGVHLQTVAGLNGAVAVFSKANIRGRPKYCTKIGVQPRGDPTSTMTTETVRLSDRVFMYDRAIAHELFHAAGIEHHGAEDGQALFTFRFADDPKNTTGKPQFVLGGRFSGTPVRIIDEASRRDLATMLEGDFKVLRDNMRPLLYPQLLEQARVEVAQRVNYPNFHMTAEEWAEDEFYSGLSYVLGALNIYVGTQHGESSGNEECVMRYSFARMYEAIGQQSTYYWITNPGSERAGMKLCGSPAGTGVNAPGREPQPRYGDAAAGRGACRDWLCVNDAIEPASDAIPQGGAKP